ncbi:MAG: chemotaxis protein CheD [Firmicutes bacterium]|nr:chemotaxis protein CheD [Bacillota bacterium]
MDNTIKVGMAELSALNHPGVLVTIGLGSCVGIALYDREKKVIGLAHAMLPSSLQIKNNTNTNKGKFADTAILELLDEMIRLGASRKNIIAKLAGGAQMFTFNDSSDIIRIGERNVIAAKEKLRELNIEIISEDTGGNYGRTIEFYSDDGRLVVKTLGLGTKEI